jgi:hypothetical protein
MQFLCCIDLVPAGNACGVIVTDGAGLFFDRRDHIAFLDLHVIDVVKKFEPLRSHASDQISAPFGTIAHVAEAVHLAVEKLHAKGDVAPLGKADDLFHGDGAFAHAPLVRNLGLAVARKADDVWKTGIGGESDCPADAFNALGMIPRPLFAAILRRIERLLAPAPT